VLLEVMKLPNQNFSDEDWVRNQWNKYDAEKHKDYTFDWLQHAPKLLLLDSDERIGREFLKTFAKELIVQVNHKNDIVGVFAWMQEQSNTWSSNLINSKGNAPFENYIFEKIVSVIKPAYVASANQFVEYKKQEFEEAKKDTDDKEMLKVIAKKHKSFVKHIELSVKRLESTTALKSAVKWVTSMVLADPAYRRNIQFNLEPNTKHLFQFKNGAFNLRTNKLEARTKEMYITSHLHYDYSEDVDKSCIDKLEQCIYQTLPDDKQREGFKRWRGLCLTGETRDQAFVVNIGIGAGNGKSTNSINFKSAFPIYCTEIGKQAFTKSRMGDSTAYNKAFGALINMPIRLVYMEEWGSETQDDDLIKKTISDDELTVQPPYMCEVKMRWQSKLEASANFDPKNQRMDNGIMRRGYKQTYNSKFVEDPADVNESAHRYLQDKSVIDLCKNPKYALALFHIFKPYAKMYYDEGKLKLPDCMKQEFVQMVSENDEFYEVFENIRPKEGAMISKQDLIDKGITGDYCADNKEHFKEIREAFESRGYKYKSQKRKSGQKTKGVFLNCEYFVEPDSDADEGDATGGNSSDHQPSAVPKCLTLNN
jgi:hypothetical protein